MEYTTNYHLPQWVESERIMMGDFNQMCSNIDGGILQAQEAADAAQSAADNIQTKVDAVQDAVDNVAKNAYSPSNKPYVVGSYTGTGQEMTINLGFRPSFLIISGAEITYPASTSALSVYNLFTGGNILPECVSFTDKGFTLHKVESNISPKLIAARKYDYIAFR